MKTKTLPEKITQAFNVIGPIVMGLAVIAGIWTLVLSLKEGFSEAYLSNVHICGHVVNAIMVLMCGIQGSYEVETATLQTNHEAKENSKITPSQKFVIFIVGVVVFAMQLGLSIPWVSQASSTLQGVIYVVAVFSASLIVPMLLGYLIGFVSAKVSLYYSNKHTPIEANSELK